MLLFAQLLVPSTLPCSILSVLSAMFDQLSRTALFALILFSASPPMKSMPAGERGILYLFVIMRGILGVVVIGFTRAAFIPICFPEADSSIHHGKAPGIAQLCFDGVGMAVSLVRAWAEWRSAGIREKEARGLLVIVVAAMAWSFSAAPFLLRLGDIFTRLGPSISMLAMLLGTVSSNMISLKNDFRYRSSLLTLHKQL